MISRIVAIARKVRMWGMRGVIDYFRSRLEHVRWHRYFAKNAATYHGPVVSGFTVVGALSSRGSTNKVLRDFCYSLKDAGIPFQTFDFGAREVPAADIDEILTSPAEFHITKYSHLVEMLATPVQDGLVPHRGRIVFWEFESGLLDAYPTLVEKPGDVIAMSDFNYAYYARALSGRRSTYKMLYPLRIDVGRVQPKAVCRCRYGLGQDDFVVFYNFSYASGWNRKNALGALRAFCQAFRDVAAAKLVFKTAELKGHEYRCEELKQYARSQGVEGRVVFIDDYLSQDDLYDLTNTCDVYLSMHRSEGFGLGIAEAMMMGKAVVVTGYSSPLEFCNESNSFIVPYKMIPVECRDVIWYSTAKEWAEPDVNAAAAILVRLFEDPSLRVKIGEKAREDINVRYSVDAFRRSVLSYLGKGSVSDDKPFLTR